MTGYEEDLAFIHDAGFGNFAVEAAPLLLRLMRSRGVREGLVVDLGCGTGLWAKELLEAGYEVLGVDISPAMTARARRRVPGARIVTASFVDVTLPACDAVTVLSEALNYKFDPRNDVRKMHRLARRVFDALRSGGVFVFDVATSGQFEDSRRHQSFYEGEDWAVLIDERENRSKRTLTREITTFRRLDDNFRRVDEIHVLQLYDSARLVKDLEAIGFRVELKDRYGSYRLPHAHVAIIATKP